MEGTGLVFEKDGKCVVLKKEGDNEFKEGHFTEGKNGPYKINGKSYRRAHDPGSPEASSPWKTYGPDWSGFVRTYEDKGWRKSPLKSFEGPQG